MKTKMILMLILILGFSCNAPELETEAQLTEVNAKGQKGKKKVAKRTINFEPATPLVNARAVNNNEVGRIMLEPTDYTGELPLDNNGGLVDWDNDGQADDLIVIENRCFFPRTFSTVSVLLNGTDKKVISYSTAFGATVLGFSDVDNDGFQDIIFEGGNHYFYNGSTYGETFTPIDSYSQFNVGYNREGQYPLSLKEIIESLEITSVDPNPEAITWDLSEYGIEAYPFHIRVVEISTGFSVQTTTYGEWGFYNFSPTGNNIKPGEPYILRFTNLGDNCTDIDVEFSI